MANRNRSVDVFVRKVRQKLAVAAPHWVYVHAHFGIGYRFAPERVVAAGHGDGRGGDAGVSRHPPGLRARTIAEAACGCTRWVSRISTSTSPASASARANSSCVSAPAMQPVH